MLYSTYPSFFYYLKSILLWTLIHKSAPLVSSQRDCLQWDWSLRRRIWYIFFDDRDDYPVYHRWVCRPWKWNEEDLVDSENIPAWSLHRLMIIANIGKSGFTNVDEAYNTCISLIASHLRFGLLNKEYFKKWKNYLKRY